MNKRAVLKKLAQWPALLGIALGAGAVLLIRGPVVVQIGGARFGDLATWVSGLAAAAAVIVALVLSGRDTRRRERERREEAALADFRACALLQPIFSHLVAVATVMPSRIDELKTSYNGTLRPAEEMLELDTIRRAQGYVDLARNLSRDLAVHVLSAFAWCSVFEQFVADVFFRTDGTRLTVNPGVVTRLDVFVMAGEEKSRRQLQIAAATLKGYAERAEAKMRAVVGSDIGLPAGVFAGMLEDSDSSG